MVRAAIIAALAQLNTPPQLPPGWVPAESNRSGPTYFMRIERPDNSGRDVRVWIMEWSQPGFQSGMFLFSYNCNERTEHLLSFNTFGADGKPTSRSDQAPRQSGYVVPGTLGEQWLMRACQQQN